MLQIEREMPSVLNFVEEDRKEKDKRRILSSTLPPPATLSLNITIFFLPHRLTLHPATPCMCTATNYVLPWLGSWISFCKPCIKWAWAVRVAPAVSWFGLCLCCSSSNIAVFMVYICIYSVCLLLTTKRWSSVVLPK